MNRKILVILVLTIVSLIGVPQAHANSFIFNQFTSIYNASGTKLNACRTCMVSAVYPVSWNKYGSDLRRDGDFDPLNPALAMRNIEFLDSDRDGFTNIEEIRNSTFPGNSSDFPVVQIPKITPSPTATPVLTPAATPAQTPVSTPVETEPVSTGTIMNVFFTTIMVIAVYFLFTGRKYG